MFIKRGYSNINTGLNCIRTMYNNMDQRSRPVTVGVSTSELLATTHAVGTCLLVLNRIKRGGIKVLNECIIIPRLIV